MLIPAKEILAKVAKMTAEQLADLVIRCPQYLTEWGWREVRQAIVDRHTELTGTKTAGVEKTATLWTVWSKRPFDGGPLEPVSRHASAGEAGQAAGPGYCDHLVIDSTYTKIGGQWYRGAVIKAEPDEVKLLENEDVN